MSSAPVQIADRGPLAEVPLPRILIGLYRMRFTGRLQLSRTRTRKLFRFQDGAAIGSESNLPAEHLTAVLEDAGLLGRKDRQAVDAYVKQNNCKEGVALLSLELIEPKRLFEGLREQVRRRMMDCFAWRNGAYEVSESEEPRQDVQPFRIDPYRLVQEGLQYHWSVERMLADIDPCLDRIPRATSRLAKVTRRLALDATVERMIAGLDGRQTLATAITSAASSPAALAAFWVLDSAGALEYSDSPQESEAEGEAPEIEIQIAHEQSAVCGSPAVSNGAETPSAGSARRANDLEPEKMRAEVLDRLERLDSLDFYELLGIGRSAGSGAIRKAYLLAAKRHHPDAIARLGLHDIRSQTGEVFSKIAEANEVLSDKKRRAAYDRSLESGLAEIDVTRIAQAEIFYRKGAILIHMGDFRGALDYMKNAVELYADEAAYQSDLAWCYYKKSPHERQPALEHIRKALQLNPTDAVAQFRQGLIERSR